MVKLLVAAAALMSGPASAATPYKAIVDSPSAARGFTVRDIYWECTAVGTCSGSAGVSRPETVCAAIAKEVGRLKSFSADGRQLRQHELEKCNAKAR